MTNAQFAEFLKANSYQPQHPENFARPASFTTKFLMMWPGLDRCATIGFRCVVDIEKPPGQVIRKLFLADAPRRLVFARGIEDPAK